MDYSTLKQTINNYSNKALEQRKTWYSPAAEAYSKFRPRYPQSLIQAAVAIAQLSSQSKILELGCGPATATIAFAQLGASMVCLEPNSDFYQLAKQTCSSYPNVEIQNTSFEEWALEPQGFDAVLAATSFHWIPPDVAYSKSAAALRQNGYLILLWNKALQLPHDVHQSVAEIYQNYAPGLDRYEDVETQKNILQGLGQMVEESGQFNQLISRQIESELTYTVDDYIMLLNTYSPYLLLDVKARQALFERLRNTIKRYWGDQVSLSYLSAFHIAQKC